MMPIVKTGLEVFLESRTTEVAGLRLGLLTNQTGTDSNLVSTIRLFHQHRELNLTALFAPEHGLKTNAKEGEKFGDTSHSETGLPVFSLYGSTKKPTDQMLGGVDAVFFDLQDIGARYYTYIYSLAYMMEACARNGKKIYVLDRPNPIGGEQVEGNLIEESFSSFVGLYPIPNRHGMTVGELALYFNAEFTLDCDLEVVKMENWHRSMFFSDTGLPWIPPSPNATSLDMMLLYPGTCLLEGTNLSEGRGTTQPFEVFGAPFIDGVQLQDAINKLGIGHLRARAVSFIPATQKFKGESCEGVQLHLIDRENFHPVSAFVKILERVIVLYPNHVEFLEYGNLKHPMFDLLAGSAELRRALKSEASYAFLQHCRDDSSLFKERRKQYLLYR